MEWVLLGMALLSLGGQVYNYFTQEDEAAYTNMFDEGMDINDFVNVNPFTEEYQELIKGQVATGTEQYEADRLAASEAMGDLEGAYDPNAWLSRFNNTGKSTIADILSPYQEANNTYAGLAGDQAAAAVENRYAGAGGGTYSGAAMNAAGEGMAMPLAQARMQEAQLQSQMSGQLMGQFQQDEAAKYQNALQLAQLLSARSQNSGNQLGSYYGMLGNTAQPEFFNPWVANPGYEAPMTFGDLMTAFGQTGMSAVAGLDGMGGGGNTKSVAAGQNSKGLTTGAGGITPRTLDGANRSPLALNNQPPTYPAMQNQVYNYDNYINGSSFGPIPTFRGF